MKFLDNFNYTNVDKCIFDLKKNKINYYSNEKLIYFHVYWYGKLNNKNITCINSYVKTQNLNKTKLIVWIDKDYYIEENLKKIPIHKNIIIKEYNDMELSKNTPFENKNFVYQKKFLKFRSDIARILFLYHYGGLYFDFDIILLKNFENLLGTEFCYNWSNLYKNGNNGLIRFYKKSDELLKLMDKYNMTFEKNKHNKMI